MRQFPASIPAGRLVQSGCDGGRHWPPVCVAAIAAPHLRQPAPGCPSLLLSYRNAPPVLPPVLRPRCSILLPARYLWAASVLSLVLPLIGDTQRQGELDGLRLFARAAGDAFNHLEVKRLLIGDEHCIAGMMSEAGDANFCHDGNLLFTDELRNAGFTHSEDVFLCCTIGG
jgi:hypothetical protein